VFGGLARLRGDRALHPDGIVYEGTFRSHTTGTGTRLFDTGDERPALLRISRGAGLPQALPDVLGCAVRVPDAYGAGAHQDFALASSARAPVGRHVLLPGRDYSRVFYSSILPYVFGEQTALIGARLHGDTPDLEVRLFVATTLGRWREVAALTFNRVASEGDTRALRFNPWNCGGGIRPRGSLNALRNPAYRGSQEASP